MSWIPCSERMPEESECVLVHDLTHDDIVIAGYDHEDGWSTEESVPKSIEVDYWMPLPEKP